MADPLQLLRQATIAGAAVPYVNNSYTLGQHVFPDTTKTCFKRSLKCKRTKWEREGNVVSLPKYETLT